MREKKVIMAERKRSFIDPKEYRGRNWGGEIKDGMEVFLTGGDQASEVMGLGRGRPFGERGTRGHGRHIKPKSA